MPRAIQLVEDGERAFGGAEAVFCVLVDDVEGVYGTGGRGGVGGFESVERVFRERGVVEIVFEHEVEDLETRVCVRGAGAAAEFADGGGGPHGAQDRAGDGEGQGVSGGASSG